MTLAILDRSPLLIGLCTIALALRPVGFSATAATLAVGAVGAVSTVNPIRTARLAWPLTVGIGVAGFVVVRIGMTAPPIRTTGIAIGVSIVAAVAEELFFRRLVYDRLDRWGAAIAVIATAVLFAAVHAPSYGIGAVPIDFAAGLVFGWQRWASGTWTAPAVTHVAANLVQVF